jgi:hypothetical protein
VSRDEVKTLMTALGAPFDAAGLKFKAGGGQRQLGPRPLRRCRPQRWTQVPPALRSPCQTPVNCRCRRQQGSRGARVAWTSPGNRPGGVPRTVTLGTAPARFLTILPPSPWRGSLLAAILCNTGLSRTRNTPRRYHRGLPVICPGGDVLCPTRPFDSGSQGFLGGGRGIA